MLLRGHPNVVKFYGFFADDTYTYIVMVDWDASGLFNRNWSQAVGYSIISRIVSSLQRMMPSWLCNVCFLPLNTATRMELCIVTWSPKTFCWPSNSLELSSHGSRSDDLTSLKLTDFGFSASVSSGLLKTSLGTPGYTAPEVLRNQLYDASVDLWSLGVITYILWIRSLLLMK